MRRLIDKLFNPHLVHRCYVCRQRFSIHEKGSRAINGWYHCPGCARLKGY